MNNKILYLMIACMLLTGCFGKWFKPDVPKVVLPEFDKKEAKANYERMSKEELIDACLKKDKSIFGLTEDVAELKNEHEGLKSWQRFAFYVFGILCFGAAIAMAQLNMRWVSKGAAGLGVVCLFAPTLILAIEKIGHTITLMLTWGLYIIGFCGLVYVVWKVKKSMVQMATHDQGLKDALKEKLDTEDEYKEVINKVQDGMDDCGIIQIMKQKAKGSKK